MLTSKTRFFLLLLFLSAFASANAADDDQAGLDARFAGVWEGSWLEGMSSGKATLTLKDESGELTFTNRPAFGALPASITKITRTEKQLRFQTVGVDSHVMRFDLKPSKDYQKLKGKAYYDSLHMELELSRAPSN
jgi:hypothetical protein